MATTISISGDSIVNENGNPILTGYGATNAVNNFLISNQATGQSPLLMVVGPDANIGIKIQPKGDGLVRVASLTAASKTDLAKKATFNLDDAASQTTTTFTISQTEDRDISFPDADGTVALQGLAGEKTYYLSDTDGGPANRKLTFKDGVLTDEE